MAKKKTPLSIEDEQKEKEKAYRNSEHLYLMLETAMIPGIAHSLGLIGEPAYPARIYEEEDVNRVDPRIDRMWAPRFATKASRHFPIRGTASVRGTSVNDTTNHGVIFESTIERDLADVLLTDRRVVEFQEQPPAQDFRDNAGKLHKHTFDFLVTLSDGTNIAIAVKAEERRKSSGIDEIVARFREQRPAGFADFYVVRTREQITHDVAYHARLILWARRLRRPEDDQVMLELLGNIHGTVRLSSILDALESQDAGFVAAVNLLDEGRIEYAETGRFDHRSLIRVAANFHQGN